MKHIATPNAPAAIGPYSQAVVANGFLYTSGQLGLDPATGEFVGDVEAQAHQVFKNILALIEAAGADPKNIVKTTVFLKDMADFAKVNAVYAQYIKEPYPARSAVAVAALPKGGLVEIETVVKV